MKDSGGKARIGAIAILSAAANAMALGSGAHRACARVHHKGRAGCEGPFFNGLLKLCIALLVLVAPATAQAQPTPMTFVTNGGPANDVTGYLAGSSGDISPAATITRVSSDPQGVAVDSSGNIYVANDGDGLCDGTARVDIYPPGSSDPASPTATITGAATDLCNPKGIALDSSDNIYVADDGNGGSISPGVYVYPALSTGNVAPRASIAGAITTLANPQGVAVDSLGNVYVADPGTAKIDIWNYGVTGDTLPSATISGIDTTLVSPHGVAVDSLGNVYVADPGTAKIDIWNNGASGSSSAPSATISGGSTTLVSPEAVAVDSSGDVYVADSGTSPYPSIDTWADGASGSSVAPTPSITGAATGLNAPRFIAITPPPAPVAFVPPLVGFGNEPVGDTAATQNLTVENIGSAPLSITSVSSNDSPEFATPANTCTSGELAPLATCTITISFTPAALGFRHATLTISDNAGTGTQTAALRGTGTYDMGVSPRSHEFGNVRDYSTKSASVTVWNLQTIPATLTYGFGGGSEATDGDFSVAQGSCRASGGSMAAKSPCALIVTFAPTTVVRLESATLTVSDNFSHDPNNPYTVTFIGSASVPESLSRTALGFGNVALTASKTTSVTLTNHGTSPITLASATITGSGFAISESSTCPASLPAPLTALSSCTYAVTFTPAIEAKESGSLTIKVDQDPTGGPPPVALSGAGVTPLTVMPASLSFGYVAKGTPVAKTATVTNSSSATLTISENVSGPYSGDFAATGSNPSPCPAPSGQLLGGASCTYSVTFTPSVGTVTRPVSEGATLGISSGVGADPTHNLHLFGAGY